MDLDARMTKLERDFARIKPLLEEWEAHRARSGVEETSERATKQVAREHIERGRLDEAGKLLGIERVTKDGGHAFDEEDDSFGKRLWAHLIGAEAAGAHRPTAPVAEGLLGEQDVGEPDTEPLREVRDAHAAAVADSGPEPKPGQDAGGGNPLP